MATCRNGRVSNAVEFVHSSSSKRNYSRDDKSMDMYDVYDYDDPEDFYYDHVDEFDDIQDAEDYWEENRGYKYWSDKDKESALQIKFKCDK